MSPSTACVKHRRSWATSARCNPQASDVTNMVIHDILNSERKYTLCYLMSTQKKYWAPRRLISGLLPSEYSTNLKVYTFFWSWVYLAKVWLVCCGVTLLTYTLFKKKCTFLKLPFFWRRVYASESVVIHHFVNAHGKNLPKIPFQNSSWFSHDLKMIEYILHSWNCKTEFLHEQWRLHFFWSRVYFSEPVVIHHFNNIPGNNL